MTKVVKAQMPTDTTVDNKPQSFQYVRLALHVGHEPTTLRLNSCGGLLYYHLLWLHVSY